MRSVIFSRKHVWATALLLTLASPGWVAFATGRPSSAAVPAPYGRPAPAALLTELVGVDRDGNGVRDDVDAFVAKQYARDEPMRAAALDMARALQSALAVDLDTVQDTAPMAEREVAVMSCLLRTLGPQRRADAEDMINRVDGRTYDTSARFQKREAFRVRAGRADFSADTACEPGGLQVTMKH